MRFDVFEQPKFMSSGQPVPIGPYNIDKLTLGDNKISSLTIGTETTMQRTTWFSTASATALALLIGCGTVSLNTDETDGGSTPDASADAALMEDLCLQGDIAFAEAWDCTFSAVCETFSRCFAGALTPEECRELDLELFDLDGRYGDILLAGALERGTITYDPDDLDVCLDRLRSFECVDLLGRNDPFDACRPFIGTVSASAACSMDVECAIPGARCVADQCGEELCCFGFCVDPAPVGNTCGGGIPCEPGALCVDGLCSTGASGSRCQGDYDCAPDFWCNPNGACSPDRGAGEPCTDNDQCRAPNTCVGENALSSGTCQPSFADGDPCDTNCLTIFSHYCDRPDVTANGVCRTRLAEGEPCEPLLMPCALGLRCNSQTRICEPYGQAGNVCEDATDCSFYDALFCSTELDGSNQGTCQGRQPDGSACTDEDHCDSGYCYLGTCTRVESCY